MSGHHNLTRPTPSFAARMVEALAATDRFVGWWGAHRGWPANEQVRLDYRR
jgi:hypothetical protein